MSAPPHVRPVMTAPRLHARLVMSPAPGRLCWREEPTTLRNIAGLYIIGRPFPARTLAQVILLTNLQGP